MRSHRLARYCTEYLQVCSLSEPVCKMNFFRTPIKQIERLCIRAHKSYQLLSMRLIANVEPMFMRWNPANVHRFGRSATIQSRSMRQIKYSRNILKEAISVCVQWDSSLWAKWFEVHMTLFDHRGSSAKNSTCTIRTKTHIYLRPHHVDILASHVTQSKACLVAWRVVNSHNQDFQPKFPVQHPKISNRTQSFNVFKLVHVHVERPLNCWKVVDSTDTCQWKNSEEAIRCLCEGVCIHKHVNNVQSSVPTGLSAMRTAHSL